MEINQRFVIKPGEAFENYQLQLMLLERQFRQQELSQRRSAGFTADGNRGPRIFVTGVTGYIAGDAAEAMAKAHNEYDFTFLVRNEAKGKLVAEAFPAARIVYGDLDNAELLKTESAAADIVVHAADASDHEGAARAIAEGLVSGHTTERPGYWLHTGGTGILTHEDFRQKTFGEESDKVYNDWSGVDELTNLPDDAFHRNVDKIVLECGVRHADVVKTVIICPPTIYGRGRGPCSVRGRQVYELASVILTKQIVPIIGAGKSRWNNIHIRDLSNLYKLLVEAAVAKNNDPEIWGAKGYMLAENGEHYWSIVSEAMAAEAVLEQLIPNAQTSSMTYDEAIEQAGFEAASWGMNSRGKAERASKTLRWTPYEDSVEGSLLEIIVEERERLRSRNAL